MENETSPDSAWASWFRELSAVAAAQLLAQQNAAGQTPAPVPVQSAPVPKWVYYAGAAVGVLALVLLLRRA